VCLDDRLAGTIDTGCDAAHPVCELGSAGESDDRCVACEDDRPAGTTDWGCNTDATYCDSSSGAPSCVECVRIEDCAGVELCCAGVCINPGATTAVDDRYTTSINTTLTVSSPANGVLANDSGPDGATLSVTLGATTPTGTLTLAPDGTFTYVPLTGY